MNPEQFARIECLFDAACRLPPHERSAFAAREAGDDAEVRAALLGLVEADAATPATPLADLEAAMRASAQAAATTPAPAHIDRFRILRVLGRGGMGVVYEAEQSHPRRHVALKVVRDAELVDPLRMRLFEREAEVLARLRHPNIAAVYESGRTSDGRPWFAMELVHGETLDQHLRSRPPVDGDTELRARLHLFAAIANAVGYAHQRGVIHRDLKPTNVLVTKAPESGSSAADRLDVKVLDFGLARVVDAERDASTLLTEVGVIRGTLPYMSPEQASGRSDEIDLRTDVYALGVILYEMLAGRRPYTVDHLALAEAVRVICEQPPPPLRFAAASGKAARFRFDVDLDNIVRKALAKEADRRYGSVQALAEDIERFLAAQPILARAPSTAYQIRKLVQRHRAAFAMGTLALLALAAATVVSGLLFLEARRESRRARIEQAKYAASSRFLEQTLQAAGPSVTLGRDATMMREVLANAAARIDRELDGQPEAEAVIRMTIGGTYTALGQFDQAAEHLDAARRLQDEAAAPSLDDRAKLTQLLGTQRWLAGHADEAEPLFRTTLALRLESVGADHPLAAEAMTDLGNVLVQRQRFDEAEKLLESGLAIRERLLEPKSEATAVSLNSLAILRHHRGDYERAETGYRQALAIQEEVLGQLHPDTITTRLNLGQLLRSKGAWPESAAVLDEALADARTAYGDRHPTTARVTLAVASALRFAGDLEAAESRAREGLAIFREKYGDRNIEVGTACTDLALILDDGNKADAAEQYFREAYEIYRSEGAGPAYVASAMSNLALVIRRRGRFAEALAMQEEALRMDEERLGPDHPKVLLDRNNLGRIQRAAGDLVAAERTFTRVVADRRRTEKTPSHHLANSLDDLGQTLHLAGEAERCRGILAEALAVARRAWSDDHVATALIASHYARALLDGGDVAVAERLLRDALAVFERTGDTSGTRTVAATAMLALAVAERGRTEEARTLCARVDAMLPVDDDRAAADSLLCRARAASALGQHDDAEVFADRAHRALLGGLGERHPSTLRAAAVLAAIRDARSPLSAPAGSGRR